MSPKMMKSEAVLGVGLLALTLFGGSATAGDTSRAWARSSSLSPDLDLLIIVPYKTPGDVAAQEDPDWVAFADTLAAYKESTGLSAMVVTLEHINGRYTEGDEPERVKRLIYDRVIGDNVRFVMLVGDASVFPVRYQSKGYSRTGSPARRPGMTPCSSPANTQAASPRNGPLVGMSVRPMT